MRAPMPLPRQAEVNRLAGLLAGRGLEVIAKDAIDGAVERLSLG